jgi:hypothetical protein
MASCVFMESMVLRRYRACDASHRTTGSIVMGMWHLPQAKSRMAFATVSASP